MSGAYGCEDDFLQCDGCLLGDGVFHIQADRFLRNMVRAVVGTLFDVGRHKKSIEDFKQIIQAKNRCVAGQSAPAEGLYLVGIEYSEDIFIENI